MIYYLDYGLARENKNFHMGSSKKSSPNNWEPVEEENIGATPLSDLWKSCGDHLLWHIVDYKPAHKIWKTTQLAVAIRSIANQDILSMLNELMRRLGKANIELVIALLWAIWRVWNQVLFKGKKEDPCILVAKAEAVVDFFQKEQNISPKSEVWREREGTNLLEPSTKFV